MDVIEIVIKGIKEAGGVGLYQPEGCGCSVDDLAPCGQIDGSCELAMKVIECPAHGKFYGAKNSDNYCPECADKYA